MTLYIADRKQLTYFKYQVLTHSLVVSSQVMFQSKNVLQSFLVWKELTSPLTQVVYILMNELASQKIVGYLRLAIAVLLIAQR